MGIICPDTGVLHTSTNGLIDVAMMMNQKNMNRYFERNKRRCQQEKTNNGK